MYTLFKKCIHFITVEKYKLNFLLANIVSNLNCSVAAAVILLKTAKKKKVLMETEEASSKLIGAG